MVVFGFFSLVLVLVYWINRAVVLFDTLIADGQSATVFLEFTALSLPPVIQLALPLAAFASAVYVTNRLSNDSELVVVQATGYSAFRLARPVLYFGLIVAVMISVLTHFLVPMSTAQLAVREREIAQNLTARLLTEGQFLEPVAGATFYVQSISPEGRLSDVFISDQRDPTVEVVYTASEAYFVSGGDQTQLVMRNGMMQRLSVESQNLSRTQFKDLAFDLSVLAPTLRARRTNPSHLATSDLLWPSAQVLRDTRRSAADLKSRGHDRFAQALLGTIGALLGFAALIVGGFSRFGIWRQVVFAIVLIIIIKAVETSGINLARSDESLVLATYAPTLIGVGMVWFLLFWSGHPMLFRWRRGLA